jgi:tetratricopeptide (TPR) repeat protein
MSQELVHLLMAETGRMQLAVVLIYRPEPEHLSTQTGAAAERRCPGRYLEMRLHSFGREDCRAMLESIMRTEALSDQLVTVVLDRSQGNPFYLEAIVRALLDAEAVDLNDGLWDLRRDVDVDVVPEAAGSVIQARVDRLQSGPRLLLQTASIVGDRFPLRLLERLLPKEQVADAHVARLTACGFVYEEQSHPEVVLAFNHVLVRQAVYDAIPAHWRARVHRHAGRALEELSAGRLEERCEEIAFHYDQGGEPGKAIHYYAMAGDKARRHVANQESVSHLSRALELVRQMPPSGDRDRLEFGLLIALGVPLTWTRGLGAPEVGEVYRRAVRLSRNQSDQAKYFDGIVGLRRHLFAAGQLDSANRLERRLIALARTSGDPSHLGRAYVFLAQSAVWQGRFGEAAEFGRAGSEATDRALSRDLAVQYGTDSLSLCTAIQATALTFLGDMTQSEALVRRAKETAVGLNHPTNQAMVWFYSVTRSQVLRDANAVQEQAVVLQRLFREHGPAVFVPHAVCLQGWAIAVRGDPRTGIPMLRRGIADYQSTGYRIWMMHQRYLLAEALIIANSTAEAASELAAVADLIAQTGARWLLAEQLRLQGDLARASGQDAQAAEALYREAVDIARSQGAPLWELRASVSLAGLLGSLQRFAEARSVLENVCDSLPDGCACSDRSDALALLDRLARPK